MLFRRILLGIAVWLMVSGCSLSNTPSATETPPTLLPQTTNIPDRIAYWQFVANEADASGNEVVVLSDGIVLARFEIDDLRTDDSANNIRQGLQVAIASPNNLWSSDGLAITDVSVDGQRATVIMDGQITAVGGAVLSATSLQFLLTIFEEDTIESAIVTLNDDSVMNLGISNSIDARPLDYVYTRAEVERLRDGG